MKKQPLEILREGCGVLDPVLRRHGFSFVEGQSGKSGGSPYATGAYANGDRKLELHDRDSIGLVTYRFGKKSLDHESYMRVLLGEAGGNRYPGFSDDPMAAFRDLAYDLQKFATAFAEHRVRRIARCAEAGEAWKKVPGLARLP
jgi:hypothetical protein